MIDLQILKQKTWDIKLEDGRTLNIEKANNAIYRESLRIKKMSKEEFEKEDIFDVVYNFLAKIFNRNSNGEKFTTKQLGEIINFHTAIYLIKQYTDFNDEVLEEINF